jgi:hypothetical protein
MEYEGLIVPIGAIADTVKRALDGAAASIRTIQRANRELMDAGFIYIYQKPSNFCRIKFNLSSFAYWTRSKTDNVVPIPTQSHNVVARETLSHNSPLTTNCRTSELTSITPVVNSQNPYINKPQRADARAINIKDKKKRRRHPVLFSLLIILRDAQSLHPKDRTCARTRAECEINALGAGIGLLNPSGVDWDYWTARWDEMTIPCRENTIRREILPLLIEAHGENRLEPILESEILDCGGMSCQNLSAEDIRKMRIQLEKSLMVPREPIEASTSPIPVSVSTSMSLSGDELAILDAARRRTMGAL